MSIAAVETAKTGDAALMTLEQTKEGQSVRVIELLSAGAERRRMLDLGILPGAIIENVMRSPLGDPTAYRIRGAVVALRSEQARQIRVAPDGKSTGEVVRGSVQ